MMSIKSIISGMTLADKISLCTGGDFWHTKAMPQYGIPAIKMSDGPHGLRCQEDAADMIGINQSIPATCFPTAVTAGATWNRELYAREGEAIGREGAAAGVSVVLGPGCNIKRNPLGGRNFEYISEDPYFAGKMAAAFIRGQQSVGVSSSVKHFAVNNQEFKRQNGDSQLDERTLREIYLTPFEIAVKEGQPGTVMCSYNKINGIHASDSRELLTDILRTQWGFCGLVVTDWGALNDRIQGYKAGCDLNMPGGSKYMEKAALEAVRSGKLDEAHIDATVERILQLVEKSQRIEKPQIDWDANHDLARKVAEQGAVLLKNEDNILPLAENDMVLLGYMAANLRYQGSGSSHINPTKLINITDALPNVPYCACGNANGNVTEEDLRNAVEAAEKQKTAVVVVGLPDSYESEAFDRDHMKLPEGHNKLVEAVAQANPNTVVVLLGGSAMELPWADKVKAILYMGLPGQAGGEAAANLLTGRANPSGKLTETWPLSYEDVIAKDTFGKKNTEYREGIYVGYRYYDKAGKPVRYPFGHGLSYTTFAYSDLTVHDRKVSVAVKNTGAVSGGEVVQLYIAPPRNGIFRPVRELKGFERVELEPGESKTVEFTLDDRGFSIWNDGWKIPGGTYTVQIYGWRLGTGFLSTPLILEVLANYDLDAAYRLLENEEMPGWLFMPKNGASTIWESWEGTQAQGGIASLNHYSKGAVCEWLFKTMCGIRMDGENHFTIAPKPGGSFAHAKVRYQSIYGPVESGWEKTASGYQLNITVPCNTTATVTLPNGTSQHMSAGIYSWFISL